MNGRIARKGFCHSSYIEALPPKKLAHKKTIGPSHRLPSVRGLQLPAPTTAPNHRPRIAATGPGRHLPLPLTVTAERSGRKYRRRWAADGARRMVHSWWSGHGGGPVLGRCWSGVGSVLVRCWSSAGPPAALCRSRRVFPVRVGVIKLSVCLCVGEQRRDSWRRTVRGERPADGRVSLTTHAPFLSTLRRTRRGRLPRVSRRSSAAAAPPLAAARRAAPVLPRLAGRRHVCPGSRV